MLLFHVIRETLESLVREARRVLPMAAGIIWGVASVFTLSAIANGFEKSQREAISAFGDSFMLLRLNKPAYGKNDPRAQKQVLIDRYGSRSTAQSAAPPWGTECLRLIGSSKRQPAASESVPERDAGPCNARRRKPVLPRQ